MCLHVGCILPSPHIIWPLRYCLTSLLRVTISLHASDTHSYSPLLPTGKTPHTREKTFSYTNPPCVREGGLRFSSKTLSGTHSCRMICEARLRLEVARQVSLQPGPPPPPDQLPRPGSEGVKAVSDILSPLYQS